MILMPPDGILVDRDQLLRIEEDVKSLYRLIVFSRRHNAQDLLSRYQEAINHLREVISFKNAQQEAHSEEEAAVYLEHLHESMGLISDEIGQGHTFQSPMDLFRLFRTISPEAAARHPHSYRQTHVQFGPCMAPAPGAIGGLIDHLFEVLPMISHPILRAVYLHHELIRIHPFVDGNGRLGRMAKNWLLMFELYPPIVIYAGSDRTRYIRTMQESFLALADEPEKFGPATQRFFWDEIARVKASCSFILNRMLKDPNKLFCEEDLQSYLESGTPSTD